MSVLLDTNILCRIADPSHPQSTPAADTVRTLLARGDLLCCVPQNIYEFWVVATRPTESKGMGMSPQEAKSKLDALTRALVFLPDVPAIFPEWQKLVLAHDCKGKPAHDARLVAAMNVHKIDQILTFNHQDFGRFPGITVLVPGTIPQSK
jgi:predicted nucleic acid-binding protein